MLFYTATGLELKTGLIAMIFSLIITMNIANNAVLFGEKPERRILIAAAVGLIGITLVFAEGVTGSKVQNLLPAIIICIVATYLASLGNMISKILQREKVSPIEANS